MVTEIDVAPTLKKKLGKDTVCPTGILGAGPPQFVHPVIEVEPQIGALFSGDVGGPRGQTRVARRPDHGHPKAAPELVDRPEIGEIAAKVRKPLERVLAALRRRPRQAVITGDRDVVGWTGRMELGLIGLGVFHMAWSGSL